MAIDETDLPNGAAGKQTETEERTGTEPRPPADDFRLRLDSPLFHRDPGMSSAARAPRLRELTWEHVVRPTAHQVLTREADEAAEIEADDGEALDTATAFPTLLAVLPPSTPSIESLLGTGASRDAEPAAPAVRVTEPPADEPARRAGPVDDRVDEPAVESSLPRLVPLAPRQQLASLSDALSGEVPSVESSLLAALEEHGLPLIEEPPPIPREQDPIVNDLAELIVRSTPAAGQPTVAPVAEPAVVAVAAAPVAPAASIADVVAPPAEPIVQTVAEQLRISGEHRALDTGQFQRVRFENPPSGKVPMTREPTSVQPAAGSAVEAELNRLAFLPDQEEEAGPVVVPPIAHGDVRPAPVAPALSQHEMYNPRQSVPPVSARASLVDVGATFVAPSRKRKSHPLRRFASVVLLLSVLGGAVFAVKYYLLDPHWSGDVKGMVSEVETARGLSFDHAVTVTTLPVTDYAVKLADVSLGITPKNREAVASAWRSLGVLTGELDDRAIGMAALADSPVFYDASAETIYVVENLPSDLYRFAMHRALTLVLLDQQYGWAKRAQSAAPAVERGIHALYDGDALAVATSLTEPAERINIVTQLYGLYGKYQIGASPSPFASTVAGRLGVALMPYFASLTNDARGPVEKGASVTDGQALDVRRLLAAPSEGTSPTAEGMLFWYHVLAARLDNDLAWRTALAWRGDSLVSVVGLSGTCVDAAVQLSTAVTDPATAAFQAWAAAGPAEAATTIVPVASGDGTTLAIHACDPGVGVPTNDGRVRLALGGAPLRAEQFRALVAAQPAVPLVQAACAVYGGDPVSINDERGIVDGADAWAAPAAHPVPDPNRLGCAPA